ncbi:hypothetical protein QBC40DRAFT_188919, partial [Triangularia verruculosa]
IKTIIRDASPRLIFTAAFNNGKNDLRTFPANVNYSVIYVYTSKDNSKDSGINPKI